MAGVLSSGLRVVAVICHNVDCVLLPAEGALGQPILRGSVTVQVSVTRPSAGIWLLVRAFPPAEARVVKRRGHVFMDEYSRMCRLGRLE